MRQKAAETFHETSLQNKQYKTQPFATNNNVRITVETVHGPSKKQTPFVRIAAVTFHETSLQNKQYKTQPFATN
ncbi:MAG: hypothetical protein ILP24_06775, partial [Paludibacteraceae bacterium]|nr:hypothetical protein [Paludibacteraceae bacterium]